MADAKIRIPIDIPAGDLSGGPAARAEIDQTKQAAAAATQEDIALERQRAADVVEARRRVSERRIAEQEEEIRKGKEIQQMEQDTTRLRLAAGAALAASARQVAALTVDVLRQYKELGVELGAFEEIGLQFADFLTSPIESTIDAFTGYKEELRLLTEGQRNVARAEEALQETIRRKREQVRKENEAFVNNGLARELQAIDEITAAYQRQKRELDALNKAREAGIRAAEDLALSEGRATPEQVAAQRGGREQAARQAEIQGDVAAAQSAFEAAAAKADAAISAFARAQALNIESRGLAAEADAAVAARDQAKLDLESVKAVAESSLAELSATAVSEQVGVVDGTKAALAEAAAGAKATLEAEAAQQGRELTAGGKEALKILTDALKDGVVTKEEMQAVATAIQQVKNSRDAADAEIKASFENLTKANEAAQASIRELNARALENRQQMEALRAQISAGN